ncbi:MAG: cytochrome c, partial [Myxococcota bacterium]|nr:cytochrome c [Myxococcota bacterium]
LASCAEPPLELADQPCPDTGTALTYESFGRRFMADHCDRCHTTARSGAPVGYRFDTHADVERHAARIFIRAAGPNVTMPPGPDDPSLADRDALAEWLACGAP